jgi:S1-C subfamily serine protease
VGDKVIRINDTEAAEHDTWSLRKLLKREGETLSLVVSRGDEELEVSITLRRVI